MRQHAGTLDAARQQHNAVAAELAAIQQEMTQLQITQWQPILAAFDQQLEVCHQSCHMHHFVLLHHAATCFSLHLAIFLVLQQAPFDVVI